MKVILAEFIVDPEGIVEVSNFNQPSDVVAAFPLVAKGTVVASTLLLVPATGTPTEVRSIPVSPVPLELIPASIGKVTSGTLILNIDGVQVVVGYYSKPLGLKHRNDLCPLGHINFWVHEPLVLKWVPFRF